MKSKEINEEELKADIQQASDLAAIASMKGGKYLKELLAKDIGNALDRMLVNRASFTHNEFVAAASDIKSKLDLVKLLTRADDNKAALEAILKDITE